MPCNDSSLQLRGRWCIPPSLCLATETKSPAPLTLASIQRVSDKWSSRKLSRRRGSTQPWAEAGAQLLTAAHKTTRSTAIGSSFVAPKNPTIKRSERIAPPIASTLHQLSGTQIHTTARAARINSTAAVTARKNPESGKPEETVTWPKGPLSVPLCPKQCDPRSCKSDNRAY